MKKIVLLLVCFVIVGLAAAQDSTSVQSQKKDRTKFKDGWVNFGVKAGLNVNHLSTRIDNFNNDTYVGFKGGAFVRVNIRKFHIQPEVNFSMVGGAGSFTNGGSYDVKMNTLEIPVLFGFKVLDFRIFNLRLQGGGFFAYNFGRSVSVNDPNYPLNNNFRSDKLASVNGGFVVGAGMDIWRFTLDARYQWGLVNMLGDNSFQQDPGAGLRHGTFEISLGFKIF